MKFGILILDLLPAFIPFEVQATDSTGLKTDPSATPTVSIYEETGADGNFDNTPISGSPFTIAKINSKTGNYGVLVDKTLFTAGKLYRVLFEATVDSINTASIEYYFVTTSANFKADVTNLDATISSRAPASEYDTEINRIDTNTISIKNTVENVTYGLNALKDILDGMKGVGWTDETLKAINDAVSLISIENLTAKAGSA